jgi:excisionase family DNA binding protein
VTVNNGRKALSVEDAGKVIGVGRSLAWTLVREGKLRTIRAGHRVLVPVQAIDVFLAGDAA